MILSTNPANNQHFVTNSLPPLHPNHNPLGYCTLRNGSSMHQQKQQQLQQQQQQQQHQQQHQSNSTTVSMSPVPNSFQTAHTTCTLPRHPTQNHMTAAHHWPSYGGTIAGVRNMTTITVSGANQPPPPPSSIAMQHLGPTPRPRGVCIGVQEDDISAETPLMIKRESTV